MALDDTSGTPVSPNQSQVYSSGNASSNPDYSMSQGDVYAAAVNNGATPEQARLIGQRYEQSPGAWVGGDVQGYDNSSSARQSDAFGYGMTAFPGSDFAKFTKDRSSTFQDSFEDLAGFAAKAAAMYAGASYLGGAGAAGDTGYAAAGDSMSNLGAGYTAGADTGYAAAGDSMSNLGAGYGGAAPADGAAATQTAPATAPASTTAPAGQQPAAQPSLTQQAISAINKGVPIASLAMNLRQQSSAKKNAQQLSANAQQQSEVSNKLLADYRAGQLSAADQQGIVQWKQAQRAQVDQYYQKAGLSNSSMHQQALQQIDTQAETMRQQAVNNMLQQGMSAAGVANTATSQAANAALANDKYAGSVMQDFMRVLGQMNTPQQQTPQQTGTPTGTQPAG